MADLEQVASDLNSASQSLQELREKYDGALDLLDNKNTEITAALESAKSNALQEVQTASDTATSQISQLKDTSLNLVNEAKNTATSEISSKKEEALGEFSQATSEFNSTKEEALSQIEQAKTEQGEKITALEQAKTEQESSITELKESVSTQGQKVTEIEENNTAQGEKITALEQAKESITADLNKKSKLLTENLTWTIGSGQETATHFNTLEKAISEALKYTQQNNLTITLQLTEDLTLTQGLNFSFCDCRNIIIDGQNHILNINNLTLFTFTKTFLPSIRNLTLKNTGSNTTSNICGIAINGGCIGLTYLGFDLIIDNFNIGTIILEGSSASLQQMSIKNCVTGVISQALGSFDIRATKFNNCNTALTVFQGGLMTTQFCTFESVTSQANIAFNTLNSNGIIFN
ncbi:TPA: hypothetical protein R4414_002058 [Campylobacter jejuni]|nr:hypothetical protein [Campylobacter jejuni]ECP9364263.1 hypothetical protein [Campylobacter jejuni]HDZ4227231.1 hypothetical protein [Campylobacter jejuni]HED4564957.1 hypothetical protein [Campylobacter jejuni]HED4565203.1 hypothetical protein [Campylobacter jejuni]